MPALPHRHPVMPPAATIAAAPAAPHAPPALTPALDFLRVLWALNHQLEVTSSEMLRTLGVTAQQRMLLRVVQAIQPVSAGVLAAILHLHPGTLSATLRRLERRRLVLRRRDPGDGRRVLVSLTPRGQALTRRSEGTVEHAVATVLRRSAPPGVKATLALLRSVTDEMRN